ncbi:MAG: ABC transporter permease [Desulfuromonadales bacterium]|nr:ABC transporter permease [Desulfuromonadales bacterium]
MRNSVALAKITFLEGIRNRSLFGIALFSLFILGLNIAIAGFFMRDIGKVSVDMNMSALTFAGILLIFFVGLNLITKDIDKKTIQLVLSKPISRFEYIFGKYIGIVFFTLFSLTLLLAMSCVTLVVLMHFNADYFFDFSWINYFLAAFFVFVKFALLTAIVIFFSSIATSAFVALICSLSVYIVGVTIEDVIFYLRSEIAIQEKVVSASLERFLDVIAYLIPNFSVFDLTMEAAHGLLITPDRVLWSLLYASVYIALLLLAAAVIFARREFF